MSRRPALVTQADVARAIRAAQNAGLRVVRVVARPDGVSIETSELAEVPATDIVPPAPRKKIAL